MLSEQPPPLSLTDGLWRNLEHVSEWVRFADTKAAAVLTLDGILATVLVTAFASHSGYAVVVYVALTGAACFLSASAAMCMACLLPRLKIGQADNVIYFAGISSYASPAEYFDELRRVALEGRVDSELARETWSRSRAAAIKYKYVRWALVALSAALAASGLLGVLIVVTK